MCPEEDNRDGENPQGQDLQGTAEVTWFVQRGEQKAKEQPQHSLHLPQVDSRGGGADLW